MGNNKCWPIKTCKKMKKKEFIALRKFIAKHVGLKLIFPKISILDQTSKCRKSNFQKGFRINDDWKQNDVTPVVFQCRVGPLPVAMCPCHRNRKDPCKRWNYMLIHLLLHDRNTCIGSNFSWSMILFVVGTNLLNAESLLKVYANKK